MELQTNGVIQVYLFSFLFSKNVLNNDHLPGIMLLDMRDSSEEIQVPCSLEVFILMEDRPYTNHKQIQVREGSAVCHKE